jgi:hypothetical protein
MNLPNSILQSSGSVGNLLGNVGDYAGQNLVSNLITVINTLIPPGYMGGMNWLCGTVLGVGTSPANGAQTNCMSVCCLTGNQGNTPPNQFYWSCLLNS